MTSIYGNYSPRKGKFYNAFSLLLSEAALCAMRFCTPIRRYANRLLAKGKLQNIVRNNVNNKILHIIVAMVRDGECFREAA